MKRGPLTRTTSKRKPLKRATAEVELRRMKDEPEDSPRFGEDFLWTALFRRAQAI